MFIIIYFTGGGGGGGPPIAMHQNSHLNASGNGSGIGRGGGPVCLSPFGFINQSDRSEPECPKEYRLVWVYGPYTTAGTRRLTARDLQHFRRMTQSS